MVRERIRAYLALHFYGMTFLHFMQDIIDGMKQEGKVRTAGNYLATHGSLKKYLEQAGIMPH